MDTKITATKNDLYGEDGKIIRSIYYLKIEINGETLQMNVGQKTYEAITKMTAVKTKTKAAA
jgi:hypothetical protein